MKKIIYTKDAPEPVGPYSQAIESDGFLFCSGQIGINPEKGTLEEGIEAQTTQAIKNIDAVLNKAGYSSKDIVKTTCFLNNIKDFNLFNKIYADYFISSPARSCVEAKLPKDALVEIEVIAKK